MPVGSCYCENVKYEYSGEPYLIATCHCSACHKTSGSMYSTCGFLKDTQLRILSGTPRAYRKEHEGGMILTVEFCGDCGSQLFKRSDAEMFRDRVAVNVGTLDDKALVDAMRPEREHNSARRTSWVCAFEGAEQMETY